MEMVRMAKIDNLRDISKPEGILPGEKVQGESPMSRIERNGAACSLRFLRFEKQA